MQGDPGGYDNHNYPEITGIYSNIFADGVFGATVGFDLNKRASLNETTSSSPGAFSNYCLNPTDPKNAPLNAGPVVVRRDSKPAAGLPDDTAAAQDDHAVAGQFDRILRHPG